MGKFVIEGGRQLYGEIKIQGAKNAVLPLFAAAVLTEEKIVLKNVPHLADVENMLKILNTLGVETKFEKDTVQLCASVMRSDTIPCSLAKELRSSVFLLGSVLGRIKRARVAYPGGCDIGLRPIDIHIKGLRDLGVKVEEKEGFILCEGSECKGGNVCLDYPSVGATENVILASVLGNNKTIVQNAAREPEITELVRFLNTMGAKISGEGSSVLRIEGVEKLHGAEFTVMPDRIVFGTYLLSLCLTGGEITFLYAKEGDVGALLSKLDKNSCKICREHGKINVIVKERAKNCESVTTQPYPGFPTDLQAPYMTYAAVSEGTCILTENIFENRFRHVPELQKTGANIVVRDRVAIISGVPYLTGAEVTARDLRGGASLVLAGLCARGITVVQDIYHIDRGYENMEETLSKVGARIARL